MNLNQLYEYLCDRCNKNLDFVTLLRENLPEYRTLRKEILDTAEYTNDCCHIIFDILYS